LEECAVLDLGVLSSRPTLRVTFTRRKEGKEKKGKERRKEI